MKLITRDTDYAVRALCYICRRKDKVVTSAELVKALKIPRPFLRKILQALNKHRLVSSSKGVGGGFVLVKSPERIQLADIIGVFQGKFRINECLFKKRSCPDTASCLLKKKLDKIEQYVLRELKSTSIAYLLR